jgi:hypothetical protein
MGNCSSISLCGDNKKKGKKSKRSKKSKKETLELDECAGSCCACLFVVGAPKEDGGENYMKPSKVYDTRLIGYDDYGNLRYGLPEHDRHHEMSEIMGLDSSNRENPDEWYIMDACWLSEWLLFVHADQDNVAPSPGPCYNHRLVHRSRLTGDGKNATGPYVAKPNLIMEGSNRVGDYRRVSKETWNAFIALYPGSGPSIKAKFPTIKENIVKKTQRQLEMESNGDNESKEDPDNKNIDEHRPLTDADKSQERKEKVEILQVETADDPYKKLGNYPCNSWIIGSMTGFPYGNTDAENPPVSNRWPPKTPDASTATFDAVLTDHKKHDDHNIPAAGSGAHQKNLTKVTKETTEEKKFKKGKNEKFYEDLYHNDDAGNSEDEDSDDACPNPGPDGATEVNSVL